METSFDQVTYHMDGAVGQLRLERPDKKNAIDEQLRDEIITAVEHFETSEDANVLVITGIEDTFSAGADVNELRERITTQVDDLTEISDALAFDRYQLVRDTLEATQKPVIAMINGYCLGGGLELALACDIRIAATNAEFGVPEINLGKFPAGGVTQRLPRETNTGVAMLLVLTGESISPAQALTYGLIQETCPAEELEERTMEIAEQIASQPLPALVLGKLLITQAERMDYQSGIELEGLLSKFLELTPERKQRITEFLDG